MNYYGNVSTSTLHAGLDTDRLFAEWWVGSERVANALAGKRSAGQPEAFIEIPRDIDELKKQDLDKAKSWQLQLRADFQRHLSEGLYCAGFEANPNGNSRYLFFKDEHIEENTNIQHLTSINSRQNLFKSNNEFALQNPHRHTVPLPIDG